MRIITALAVIGTGLVATVLLKRRAHVRAVTARDRGINALEATDIVIGAGQQTAIETFNFEARQRLPAESYGLPSATDESVSSYSESRFPSAVVPAISELEIKRGPSQTAPTADSEPHTVEARGRTKMRITKRSGGGRGEYEVSDSFGSLTPRDLINHIILLDLGSQVGITTGVRLLLTQGKLRLRIDEKADCEIHLHRQLAAALMLPYPVREESKWASDFPVLQSGLYGIRNIAFSYVTLRANRIACMTVDSVSLANQDREEYIQSPERLTEVMRLWERCAEFPPELASLLVEHKRLVLTGGPLGLRAEEVVADLQEAAAHYQAEGEADFLASYDVLPHLIRLLQPDGPKSDIGEIASEPHSLQNMSADFALTPACGGHEADLGVTAREATNYESRVSTSVELKANDQSKQDKLQLEIPDLTMADSLSAAPEEPEIVIQAAESEGAGSLINNASSPRKYRPQPRGAVVTTRGSSRSTPPREQRDISIPVGLRLRSRIGGTYMLTFLPRRRTGMPPELEVVHSGHRIQLSAFHEEWYQDIVLPEAGKHLREGLAWHTEGSNRNSRWRLAGREVFVFGTRNDLSGFISVPRLVLGAQHIVICDNEILQRVLDILRECCERIPQTFGERDGLPAGWIGIGPLVPTVPLPPSEAGDILDALRPDPAVVIEFEGGIRIKHNQFLVGYPPQVHVYGSIPDYVLVMIDGQPAEKSDNGFTNTGWDSLGEHTVSCGAGSSSYIVVEPDDGWERWPSNLFPLNTQRGSEASASICGALVSAGHTGSPVLLVPISATVLLGSQPGEIYEVPVRQDLRSAVCPAFPPFDPIWAVPKNPLRAAKTTARILLLQEHAHTLQASPMRRFQPSRAVRQWCMAILDCSRKGLDVDPPDDNARRLWRSYRDLARRLWRASR